MRARVIVPTLYILFLLLPIYWLVNMSFKTNTEIVGGVTLWPQTFTFANYMVIFTDASWYSGYINSIIYVVMNTVISLAVALPAAYAFSRYRFLGDKHLFFWLLSNRMAPPSLLPWPTIRPVRCSTARMSTTSPGRCWRRLASRSARSPRVTSAVARRAPTTCSSPISASACWRARATPCCGTRTWCTAAAG